MRLFLHLLKRYIVVGLKYSFERNVSFMSGGKAAVGLFGKALAGLASTAEQDKGKREPVFPTSIFFHTNPFIGSYFSK